MTLDANKYRAVNAPLIATYLNPKTPEERLEFIGRMALITGVPIVLVAVYVGELYGFTDKLYDKLEVLKKFYQIEKIDNIKE